MTSDNYEPEVKCSFCGGGGIRLDSGMKCRYCNGTGLRSPLGRNLQRAGWRLVKKERSGSGGC